MILLWTAPGSLWGLKFTRREQKQFPKNNMVVDVITHGESTCKEEFVKHKTQNIQSSCYANGNGAPTKMCADISDGNVLSVKWHI